MPLSKRAGTHTTAPSAPSALRRLARRPLLLSLLLGAVALPAQAQAQAAYPSKPVRLIVSYAPGNVTDLLARVVADQLSAKWGQPVTVENRPGQGGSLGAQMAAKAPADGYTLLFSAMAAFGINPHLYANVGYDATKDFSPIVNVAYPGLLMVVSPALKINSFKDLVAYSKAHPTALNYGTAGNGTVPHLTLEALKADTGLIAQHVPYKSAPAVTTDVIGGRVQIQMDAQSVLLAQVKAKTVVPIVGGASARLPETPDVPTLNEVAPGFVPVVPWLGILAPAGTPKAIVEQIYTDVAGILRKPDVKDKFTANGLTISGDGPDAFGKTIAYDYQRMGKLVKQLNLKVD